MTDKERRQAASILARYRLQNVVTESHYGEFYTLWVGASHSIHINATTGNVTVGDGQPTASLLSEVDKRLSSLISGLISYLQSVIKD